MSDLESVLSETEENACAGLRCASFLNTEQKVTGGESLPLMRLWGEEPRGILLIITVAFALIAVLVPERWEVARAIRRRGCSFRRARPHTVLQLIYRRRRGARKWNPGLRHHHIPRANRVEL